MNPRRRKNKWRPISDELMAKWFGFAWGGKK